MSSFYDLASLVMIPSGKKAGKVYSQKPLTTDGQLNLFRASTATRIGPDGKIEKTRKNSFLQSNSFNTTWTATSVTLTSGQAGYDGTNNAWLLSDTTGLGEHRLVQNSGLVGIITISVYAKANTLDFIFLRGVNSSANKRAWFNLSTGSVGTQEGIEAKMTSVGNGWYRCSFTLDHQSGFEQYIGTSNANGVASYAGSEESVYIQNAQVEQGLVATDYIATTTAAVSVGSVDNMPRLNYTPGSATSCPSLLLEPQSTNLATQSEYLDPIFNEASGVSWEANATISPEGVVNAAKLNNSNTSTQGAYSLMSFTNNDTMVASIFAKEGTNNDLRFGITNQNESKHIYYNFDLTTGTFVFAAEQGGMINYSADIIDYGNGWFRCIVISTFPSSGVTSGGVYPRIIGNGNLYLYGLQVEKNVNYATSYIPTFGATVTRVADNCQKVAITSLIGQSEGTLFLDFVPNNNTDLQIVYQIRTTGGGAIGQVDFRIGSGNLTALGNDNGSTQFSISAGSVIVGTRYKCAVRYKTNDVAFYVNGSLAGTDTTATFTVSSKDQFTFSENAGSLIPQCEVEKALLFKTGLTNDQLAELTSLDS